MGSPTEHPGEGARTTVVQGEGIALLPEASRRLTQIAACLGPAFDACTLAVVVERGRAAVLADLKPAIEAGLIAPEGEGFAFAVPVESVYGLIPACELPALHLRIGRRLASLPDASPEAIEHLGRGARLLEIAHEEAQRQLALHQKLAALGTLAAGVAHEIKNPLNFINNFAELSVTLAGDLAAELGRAPDRGAPESASRVDEMLAELEQNVSKIRAHGGRAEAIVRGMLEQAQGRAGQARETDLNELVRAYARAAAQGREARDDGHGPAGAPALEITLDGAVGRLCVVPEEIGRVVLNLVSNALYAAEAQRAVRGDGFTPTVQVSTRALPGHVEVRVRDNGAGIEAAHRGRVFTPFFTTKPAGEGTGLGLSLSREILARGHAGSLAFETEDGAFTEFVVTLPRRT